MTEHISITTNPLPPAQNFDVLRREGIAEIARLDGHVWTDHNAPDPGITILEQLCFVITDLGYQLSFDIKDLLTPAPQTDVKQFFTAAEALTIRPVTQNDYRRLIIDHIEGVENAWVEAILDSKPPLFLDIVTKRLTHVQSDSTVLVPLLGLYRVILDIKEEFSKPERQKVKIRQVKEAVQKLLYQNRNVCEDFAEIIALPVERISLRGAFDLALGTDPETVMANIYYELDRYICPPVNMYSLTDLQTHGLSTDDIYNGPPLNHGFLPEQLLEKSQPRTDLRVSDMIQIILDMQEVKTVRYLAITNQERPSEDDWQEWFLELSTGRISKLTDIDVMLDSGLIEFYKQNNLCVLDINQTEQALNQITQAHPLSTAQFEDMPVPRGKYRNLGNYRSVQYEFPSIYGIGDVGLPTSVGKQRLAQAKQLQAYLLFFDQILADYAVQLAQGATNLLAVGNDSIQTYFPKILTESEVPGADAIFKETYPDDLQDMIEPPDSESAYDRRNRLYDHLLARLGETYIDRSLLQLEWPDYLHRKSVFLQNCAKLVAERNVAFNYSDEKTWDTDNVSGLKRYIGRLLGIEQLNRTTIADADEENFHLLESILLRPEGIAITGFKKNGLLTTCTSPQQAILDGTLIEIFTAGGYDDQYRVENSQTDTFDIEKPFEAYWRWNQRDSILSFSDDNDGGTRCESPNHGLKNGDTVEIFMGEESRGPWEVINSTQQDFCIKRPFSPKFQHYLGEWQRILPKITGFSQQTDKVIFTAFEHGLTNNNNWVEMFVKGESKGIFAVSVENPNKFSTTENLDAYFDSFLTWKLDSSAQPPVAFQGMDNTADKKTKWQALDHGLIKGDKIEIFMTQQSIGKYIVAAIIDENQFQINKVFDLGVIWLHLHEITEFSQQKDTGTICVSLEHGLTTHDQIEIFSAGQYMGKCEVTAVEDEQFDINATFGGKWRSIHRITDIVHDMTTCTTPNHGLTTDEWVEIFTGTPLVSKGKYQVTVPANDPNTFRIANSQGVDQGKWWRISEITGFYSQIDSTTGILRTVCTSVDNGLVPGESIEVFVGAESMENRIISAVDEDKGTFEITKSFKFNANWTMLYSPTETDNSDDESLTSTQNSLLGSVLYPEDNVVPGTITGFEQTHDRTICFSPNHGLQTGAVIEIYVNTLFKGRFTVRLPETQDNNNLFQLDHILDFDVRWRHLTDTCHDTIFFPIKNGTIFTSVGHGIHLNELVSISLSGAEDGIYKVTEVIPDQFAAQILTGNWGRVYPITGFSASATAPNTQTERTTCTSEGHDLAIGEEVLIFDTAAEYDGKYKVVARTDTTFDIEHDFVVGSEGQTGNWARLKPISKLADNFMGGTTCESRQNGLRTGTPIRVDTGLYDQQGQYIPGEYDGTYTVTAVKENKTFDIDRTFPGHHRFVTDAHDPYSMKLTFVFPSWTGRCQSPQFRQLAENVIRQETPAQIACKVLWLDQNGMARFETDYQEWLQQKAHNGKELQAAADRLYKWVE